MKMNLGCGYDIREGWVNVDRDYTPHFQGQAERFTKANVLDGLPFEDGSFSLIFMGHVLHMFSHDQVPFVLAEVRRLLEPDGVLRVIEMDVALAIDFWRAGGGDWFPIADKIEDTLDGKFLRFLTWHSTRRTLYTADYARTVLERAGFLAAIARFGDCELDQRETESFVIEGIKT